VANFLLAAVTATAAATSSSISSIAAADIRPNCQFKSSVCR